MFKAIRAQLALDMNCDPGDFDRDGFVFTPAADLPGRRPFPRAERHFEMLTTGRAILVCATPDILPYLRNQLEGKSRDEAFSMPFVYGHSLYYVPDNERPVELPLPDGFRYELRERADIPPLYGVEGFRNALGYDVNHPRPDMLAFLAWDGETIAGMAGVSADCERLWQVGIDVLPAYRGHGLAAALVSRLTREVARRGYIPYYGTASSNVASQRVAHRAGYLPAWMCSYRGQFADL